MFFIFRKKKSTEWEKLRVVGVLEEDYRTLRKNETVSVRYIPYTQQCVVCAQNRRADDPDAEWMTSRVKKVGIKSSEWRRDGHVLTVITTNKKITVKIPEEEYEKASNIIRAATGAMIA